MKLYIQTVNDAGETIGVFKDCFCTCDDCVFFKHLHDDRLPKPYICMNSSAMIHPTPEGFCNYAVAKSRTEADHE